MTELAEPEFHWCRSTEEAIVLARLFHGNLTASYVSHSELQGPRALAPGSWVSDIGKVLEDEIVSRIGNPLDPPTGSNTLLAVGMTVGAKHVGVFLLTFARSAVIPFCILEDMVIASDQRGRGYGEKFTEWLVKECRARGIKRLFLESGIENHRAHEFFKRMEFNAVSVVMMKEITD